MSFPRHVNERFIRLTIPEDEFGKTTHIQHRLLFLSSRALEWRGKSETIGMPANDPVLGYTKITELALKFQTLVWLLYYKRGAYKDGSYGRLSTQFSSRKMSYMACKYNPFQCTDLFQNIFTFDSTKKTRENQLPRHPQHSLRVFVWLEAAVLLAEKLT